MGTRLKIGGSVLALALTFVGAWEGRSLVAYRDGGGVPTICFGSTRGVAMGDTATAAECGVMFAADLARHEAALRACLKAPDALPDGVYTAMLSWAYNVGTGAACGSTLVRLANAGQVEAACNQLPRWNKDNGRVVRGLSNRRAAEQALCLAALK